MDHSTYHMCSPMSTVSTKVSSIERQVRAHSTTNDAGIVKNAPDPIDNYCPAQPHGLCAHSPSVSDKSCQSGSLCDSAYSTSHSIYGIGTAQDKHRACRSASLATAGQSQRASIYASYPSLTYQCDATKPERLDNSRLKYTGHASIHKKHTSKHESTKSHESAKSNRQSSSKGKTGTRCSTSSRRTSCASGMLSSLDFSYKNYYPTAQHASATVSTSTSSNTKRRSSRILGPVSIEPGCITH